MGWLYAVFAGLSLGALVWVNVHPTRLRYYNLSALSLRGAHGLDGGDGPLHAHGVAVECSGRLPWRRFHQHAHRAVRGHEERRPSIYPAKGFPALPPKRASKRVVCLGVLHGWRFQNDSDEFYPALTQLQTPPRSSTRALVGGPASTFASFWMAMRTTSTAMCGPSTGVNENLPTPMPFADLYEAWKNDSLSEGIAVLDKIRLYQALRLFARSFRPGGGVGVPPESLRDNLRHIVGLAQARGVKVLLMSEGVRPDPRILWHYSVVMKEVAEESGVDVHYIDVAARLDEVGDRAFIDSNHLTDLGHRSVADLMAKGLTALGWWWIEVISARAYIQPFPLLHLIRCVGNDVAWLATGTSQSFLGSWALA